MDTKRKSKIGVKMNNYTKLVMMFHRYATKLVRDTLKRSKINNG